MFIIEFLVCVRLQDCAVLIDIPRSKHKTEEECMKVAYVKAFELIDLYKQLSPEVNFKCIKEISENLI